MMTVTSAHQCANDALRTYLTSHPGAPRKEVIERVMEAANCNRSMVIAVISEAAEMGFLTRAKGSRTVFYTWTDTPAVSDEAARVVRCVPASELPPVSGQRYVDGIGWGLHHLLRAFA